MFVRQNHKPRKQRSFPAGPRQTKRMGMSVKCMIFCEGDILLLQRKIVKGSALGNFRVAAWNSVKIYMMRLCVKSVKKQNLPWSF